MMNYRGGSVLGDEVEKPVDTPIELPVTPLGEVAELLRDVQENMGRARTRLRLPAIESEATYELLITANDKLAQARILVDVERGDGQ